MAFFFFFLHDIRLSNYNVLIIKTYKNVIFHSFDERGLIILVLPFRLQRLLYKMFCFRWFCTRTYILLFAVAVMRIPVWLLLLLFFFVSVQYIENFYRFNIRTDRRRWDTDPVDRILWYIFVNIIKHIYFPCCLTVYL